MSRDDKGIELQGPVRMCVACRTRFNKYELTRYVCPGPGTGDSDSEHLISDPGQRLPGRGFYVCGQDSCQEKFSKMAKGLKKKCKGVAR